MKIALLAVVLLLAALVPPGPTALAAATLQVHTLQLQYQRAAEIIPLVQPFLPEHGVITGEGQELMIRTTPANLQEIEKLVRQLDTPLRQLQITVSVNPPGPQQNLPRNPATADVPAADGERPAPAGASGVIRQYRTEGRQLAPGMQTIQVLEKNWAMIKTGQAVPVVSRTRNPDGTVTETITYQQLNQGLRLRPELVGDKVILEVQPFYEAESRSGGGRQVYFKAATTVQARLGQWLALASSSGRLLASEQITQKSYRTQRHHETDTALYIRIDLAP